MHFLDKPLRVKPQQNILVTKSAALEGKEVRVETMDVFCWLPRFIMMITMMMSS